MARQEHHRDRFDRYERILNKRFPQGTASPADIGKLLGLRIGVRHERMVADWCEEAIDALVGDFRRGERRAVRGRQRKPRIAASELPARLNPACSSAGRCLPNPAPA